MEVLIVDSNSCNNETFTVLDLSSFVMLKLFKVGYGSFENVNEVKLRGLKKLERVVIGTNSFTKQRNGNNPTRHFYLKGCDKLKELKIGCWSFSDFSVCVIDSLASLEVIEMGELQKLSCNFYSTKQLELKSAGDDMK